jgi:hypothetical protein
MFRLKLRLWYVGLAFLECAGMIAAQTATHPVTIESLINIKHPSNPVWSPDGKHIAFLWDRADVVNLFLANADGMGDPLALTSFPDGKVTDVFWSKDGTTIYFSEGGDLWQVAAGGGVARAVWTTPGAEAQFSQSPDGTRLAFIRVGSPGEVQRGADLIIRSMSDGAESKIAHDDESIYEIKWSPDGSQIAYIAGSRVIRHDESPSYSGEKLIYAVFEYAPGQLYVVPAAGGKPTAIDTQGEYNGLAWTDSAHLTYDRQSNAFRTRTIYLAGATGDPPHAIHEDKEDKFWSLPDWEAEAKPKPSPDGKWICFLTDLDGWDHLYVSQLGAATQCKSQKDILKRGDPRGHTTAPGLHSMPMSRIMPATDESALPRSAAIPRTRASLTSPPAAALTSRRSGLRMISSLSTNTPTRKTPPTCLSWTLLKGGSRYDSPIPCQPVSTIRHLLSLNS